MSEQQAPVVASNDFLADVSKELRFWLDVLNEKPPTDKIFKDRRRVTLLLDRVNSVRNANAHALSEERSVDLNAEESARLLDNAELSAAILQTFQIINQSSPTGPEITRAREHWFALLAERERRLSNKA